MLVSIFFQVLAITAATLIFLRWRAQVRRRNAQSWESLVARLQPDWNLRVLHESFVDTAATPQERWEQLQGARGLCAMYRNANVMLDMVDYATRHGAAVDHETLAALRSDALHIRLFVAIALIQYAFSQLNEGICANALRAASMYRAMSGRMYELVQVYAGGAAPQLVGAM